MINFVCGSPGGGKSLFGVRLVVEELIRSSRFVVTNISFRLEVLQTYVDKEIGPDRAICVAERVRLLTDEETQCFWLYEGPNRSCVERTSFRSGDLRTTVPNFGERARTTVGTLYVIDECHVYFNAREWAKVSFDAQFFLSQHRKLGADVVLISQHPEQVDKNFRRLAQDFTKVRNLGNETILGFTVPKTFRWATYLGLPGPQGGTPSVTGFFRLDVAGLGACYDSNAGVGVVGRSSMVEKRAGGRSLWWLVVVGLVFILGVIYVPRWVNRGFSYGLKSFVEGGGKVATKVVGVGKKEGRAGAGSVAASTGGVSTVHVSEALGSGSVRKEERPIFLRSVQLVGREYLWELSDGRQYDVRSKGWQAGGPDWVVIDGRRYWRTWERGTNRGPVSWMMNPKGLR